MRKKGPLDKPEGCPDWVYIIMHQCWAFDSLQRPPFLALFDCLTSRYLKNVNCFVENAKKSRENVYQGGIILENSRGR